MKINEEDSTCPEKFWNLFDDKDFQPDLITAPLESSSNACNVLEGDDDTYSTQAAKEY